MKGLTEKLRILGILANRVVHVGPTNRVSYNEWRKLYGFMKDIHWFFGEYREKRDRPLPEGCIDAEGTKVYYTFNREQLNQRSYPDRNPLWMNLIYSFGRYHDVPCIRDAKESQVEINLTNRGIDYTLSINSNVFQSEYPPAVVIPGGSELVIPHPTGDEPARIFRIPETKCLGNFLYYLAIPKQWDGLFGAELPEGQAPRRFQRKLILNGYR